MREAAVVVMLVAVGLSGCFGGGGHGRGPSAAGGADELPTLPEGLEMEGAEVVSYNETSVTWRWEDHLGPGACCSPDGPVGDVAETMFDVPAGMALAISADMTWQDDGRTLLYFRIEDAQTTTVCSQDQGVTGSLALEQPPISCSGRREATADSGSWLVHVDSTANLNDDLPFTMHVTLEALPPLEMHSVKETLPFEVAAADGTMLRGHVYLPDGEAPFATVLELSPYWNTWYWHTEDATVQAGDRTTLRGWLGPFLDAGFAVALVNSRGSGESGGCIDLGGPTEVDDAGRVIEALADEPWSNGNVGMIGHSQPGWTQYMAVASGAPSLKAVVPASAVLDYWNQATATGAPHDRGPFQSAFLDVYFPTGDPTLTPDNEPGHYTCPHWADGWRAETEAVWNGDRTTWYAERDLRPAIQQSSVAIFATHGLRSGENVQLNDHALWDLIPHENKRLLLGQWVHAWPQDAGRPDFLYDAVAWLDHYLRGGDEIVEPGVVEFQDTSGTWHTAASWPPNGTTERLYLSDGSLVEDASDVVASEGTFQSVEPQRGLPDACPGHKVQYVSPPLVEDVVIAGVYSANLTASSTHPDGNFATGLWHVDDVWPCGNSPDGALGLPTQAGIEDEYQASWAMSDLRHRGHMEQGSDFPLDRPDVMRMTSQSYATHVPAGERLVLVVAGGDPRLAEDAFDPLITVRTGPDVEGELVLNVVEGDLAFDAGGGAESLVGGVVG